MLYILWSKKVIKCFKKASNKKITAIFADERIIQMGAIRIYMDV